MELSDGALAWPPGGCGISLGLPKLYALKSQEGEGLQLRKRDHYSSLTESAPSALTRPLHKLGTTPFRELHNDMTSLARHGTHLDTIPNKGGQIEVRRGQLGLKAGFFLSPHRPRNGLEKR